MHNKHAYILYVVAYEHWYGGHGAHEQQHVEVAVCSCLTLVQFEDCFPRNAKAEHRKHFGSPEPPQVHAIGGVKQVWKGGLLQ